MLTTNTKERRFKMQRSKRLLLGIMLTLILTSSGVVLACDTGVALPDATKDGYTILGKNSDRPIFDCQPLEFHPRESHTGNGMLKLEYISIPQVEETYATVGSSPYWCWGYEEGLNEYGVAIGNEAIFTKTFREAAKAVKAGHPPKLGLLGMDILRLALERSKTAKEAVQWIGKLVEKYGQFGSGVPAADHASGGYDNSYIVADSKEAWVVETYAKHWSAKRITKGTYAISNEPSITTKWDLSDPNLVKYAVKKGWWPANRVKEFNAALAYLDFYTSPQVSHIRAMRYRQLLNEKKGSIDVDWIKRILRDHYETTFLKGPQYNDALPDFLTICMHSSPAGFTWGNTASSAVFVLPPKGSGHLPVMWWNPGPPCNGIYVPVFVDGSKLPNYVTNAGKVGTKVTAPNVAKKDRYSSNSYWWEFRKLIDLTKGDEIGSVWNIRHPIVRKTFDKLEAKFERELPSVEKKALAAMNRGDTKKAHQILDAFTAKCFDEALRTVRTLQKKVVKYGKPLNPKME